MTPIEQVASNLPLTASLMRVELATLRAEVRETFRAQRKRCGDQDDKANALPILLRGAEVTACAWALAAFPVLMSEDWQRRLLTRILTFARD